MFTLCTLHFLSCPSFLSVSFLSSSHLDNVATFIFILIAFRDCNIVGLLFVSFVHVLLYLPGCLLCVQLWFITFHWYMDLSTIRQLYAHIDLPSFVVT